MVSGIKFICQDYSESIKKCNLTKYIIKKLFYMRRTFPKPCYWQNYQNSFLQNSTPFPYTNYELKY